MFQFSHIRKPIYTVKLNIFHRLSRVSNIRLNYVHSNELQIFVHSHNFHNLFNLTLV